MMLKRLVKRAARMNAAALWCAAATVAAAQLYSATIARADEPTSVSSQSQANRLSLLHDYGLSAIGTSKTEIPGEPGGGMLRRFMGGWASWDNTPPDRDLSFNITPLAGYDSNPEANHDEEGSFFGGFDANAGYKINLEPDNSDFGGATQFWLDYDVTGAIYEGPVKQANVLQQTFTTGARHGFFKDWVVIAAEVQDQFTLTQGDAFLNTVDVTPSVNLFWLPQLSTELSYEYTNLDYFYSVLPSQDPDADRHTVMGTLHVFTLPQVEDVPVTPAWDQLSEFLRETVGSATIGVGHVVNEADGTSYRYSSNRLTAGLQGLRLPHSPDFSMDIMYAHEWQHFSNASTENPPTLGGSPRSFLRHDQIDIFTLRADARLMDLPRSSGTIAAFLQYDLILDQSNVFARDYNEDIVSFGLTYHY